MSSGIISAYLAGMLKPTLLSAALAASVYALPDKFVRTEFVAGFNSPLSMAFAPDGRLFVQEQAGKIRVVKNGVLLPTPFATMTTWAHRESMLGIAFDPDFVHNGYVYTYYQTPAQKNRISRLTADRNNPDVAVAGSELPLLDGIGDAGYQGGAFFFGKDGMLYAGSAHPGSQDPNSLFGKALRINPAGYPNIIPADNPFVGKTGYRPEIYALGFREPFTGAVDPLTGDMVFLDVGESTAEEIDLLKKGANYGYEGGCEGACTKAGMENPLLTYGHNVGNCITGAAYYRGNAFPAEYQGSLFYADWGASWIKRRTPDGQSVDFDNTSGQIIQLAVGPDGDLYMLKINGQNIPWTGSVLKVSYTGAVSALPRAQSTGFAGPETPVLRHSGVAARFLLGSEPLRGASLEIYSTSGARVHAETVAHPGKELSWDHRGARAGAYPFVLRMQQESGSTAVVRGTLMLD